MSHVNKKAIDVIAENITKSAAINHPDLQKNMDRVIGGIRRFVDDFDREFDKRKIELEADIRNRSLRKRNADSL